jgi:hypothetical protein
MNVLGIQLSLRVSASQQHLLLQPNLIWITLMKLSLKLSVTVKYHVVVGFLIMWKHIITLIQYVQH